MSKQANSVPAFRTLHLANFCDRATAERAQVALREAFGSDGTHFRFEVIVAPAGGSLAVSLSLRAHLGDDQAAEEEREALELAMSCLVFWATKQVAAR